MVKLQKLLHRLGESFSTAARWANHLVVVVTGTRQSCSWLALIACEVLSETYWSRNTSEQREPETTGCWLNTFHMWIWRQKSAGSMKTTVVDQRLSGTCLQKHIQQLIFIMNLSVGPVKAPLHGSGFHTSVGKETRAQTLQGGQYLQQQQHQQFPSFTQFFLQIWPQISSTHWCHIIRHQH